MADFRVQMNRRAVAQLLVSDEVADSLLARAQKIADDANAESSWGGYYAAVTKEGKRARARVWNIKLGTSDEDTRNNRLIRSLDAGR